MRKSQCKQHIAIIFRSLTKNGMVLEHHCTFLAHFTMHAPYYAELRSTIT